VRIQDPEGLNRKVQCVASKTDDRPGIIVLGQYDGGGFFVTRYTPEGEPIRTTRWDTPDRNRALEIFWQWGVP
jgi:hypothetical protein